MFYLRVVRRFIEASSQNELAHRTNFWISLVHSVLGLATSILSLIVLFDQVETIRGWNLASTLALLGVYLVLNALRALVIGPSLDALAGIGGEIWNGQFDFTLLRPIPVQFQASLRHWRPLKLIDLALGWAVLAVSVSRLQQSVTPDQLATFLLTLVASATIIYALLLAFTGFLFWSPGFLFTWVFDGLFQMARYPVGLYPGWLRLVLTWVVPVGVMTTVPARALTGALSREMLIGSLLLATAMVWGASLIFRRGLRQYASASS